MIKKKLTQAPLQEVVFELRWESQVENNNLYDEGYDLAMGVFHQKIKNQFPKHKKIYQDGISVFGLPMQQYWKDEQKWPVIQHGPCVLVINDIEENYDWESGFKPLILNCISKLTESYSVTKKFNQLTLQYIDVFKSLDDINIFVQNKLNITLDTNIEGFDKSEQFSYYKNFTVSENSMLHLSISTANTSVIEQKYDALMITINFVYSGIFDFNNIGEIIDLAHDNTSLFFKKLLKTDFYGSLV